MLVGAIINKKRYSKTEYAAVGLITMGVMLFSLKRSHMESLLRGGLSKDGGTSDSGFDEIIGLSLAGANLLVDGKTHDILTLTSSDLSIAVSRPSLPPKRTKAEI